MHLTDAGFGQSQRGANFLHRQLFVVVENDDESFIAIEAFCDQLHDVAFLDPARRVFALGVLDDVDLADILVAVRLVPLLIQADQIDGAGFGLQLLVLFNRDSQLA